MSGIDILLLAVIGVCAAMVVRKLIRDKKAGKSCCGCSSSCRGNCGCSREKHQ